MSYVYLKSENTPFGSSAVIKKLFAYFFLIIGLVLLSSAVFPILQYQLEYSSRFGQIINPLSSQFYNREGNVLGDLSTDYTQLSNWFVADSSSSAQFVSGNDQKTYTISIPELKIDNAVVKIGSQDLKSSLIQYPQTALPGQPGSAVIFGHSVLPQFFSPKSYLTIFSTLYRLKPGSPILVNFDGIQYRYLVEDMFEVEPTDLSILEQQFNGRYFTLVTCTPPGTYLRRLVVRARIVDY